MPYDKNNYRAYWNDRVSELKTINHAIWGFVGAASLLEIGAKLGNNGTGGRSNYKNFVRTLGSKYVDFQFQNGKKDLDVQMYHVFRCGLLHSFCLVADSQGSDAGARSDSIVLASLKDEGTEETHNCISYTKYNKDACILVLEPFVTDIGIAIGKLFEDSTLEASIEATYKQNPPFNTYR